MRRALILAGVVAVGSLGGFVPGAQGELRVGKNFRLNSDPNAFRAKDMVALAVNPGDSQHIVEVNANYLTQDCEGTASFDGGDTWTTAAPFRNPQFPPGEQQFLAPCRISTHLAESMYQTVAFGSGRNVYATYITPRSTATGGEQGASTLVVKSTDGGVTWQTAAVAMVGGATGSPYFELPTLTVEPGAGTGGADRVYVVARETTAARGTLGDATTAVSNDGGQTFSAPVDADPPGEDVADAPSQPVIGPSGSVFVAWRQGGVVGTVKVARSTNQGQSWDAPVTATSVSAANTRAPTSHVVPAPSTNSTFPRLAVDRSGGPQNGNLYLVYNQGPNPALGFQGADHFIDPDLDVYLQRSTNGGAAWSTPKLINEGAARPGSQTTQTRHPNVSVAPNGRVDIVWQDRRHWYQGPGERNCVHTHLACDDARLGDTYYAFSTDGGTSFSRRRVSDRSHNNDVGYDYRFGTGWAFGPVSVPLGNDQLLVGWMDSREGSFDNDNQDIYLAKVDHAGPAAIPQETIQNHSMNLSSLAYPGGGEGILAGTFATRNGTRVVIVNEGDVPGTLAAGVLARANLSPVLHSPASGLPNPVKAEVAKLNPAGAYVIGNEGSLSGQVVADLAAAGVPNDQNQIVRLAGPDDAGTARLIAERMDRRSDPEKAAGSPPAFDAAVIANPSSPDASAASALAAARRLPILYVNADSVPPATAAALGSGSLDIDRTLVIGGPQWVSDGVVSQLPNPKRLGGADQYATSKAVVAESRERGLADNIAYVAEGDSPMDGALLGAAVGRTTGLLLLAPPPLETSGRSAAADMGLSALLDRLILAPRARGIPGGPDGGPGPGPAPQAPSIPGAPSGTGSPAAGLRCVTRARVGRSRSVRLCVATNPPAASTRQTVAGRLPRTNYAADAAQRRRKRTRARTLGSGRTTIPAGQTRPVTARLSVRAARALARKRKLKVGATILVRGVDGRTETVRRTVTLKPAKKKRKSRRKR